MKAFQNIPPFVFILIATILEVSGDAIIRTSIYNKTGLVRVAFMALGALLVFGYAYTLNSAPVEFGQVVGLYIATLFMVWQIINFIAFGIMPTLPIVVGGVLVVTGGIIITFWKP